MTKPAEHKPDLKLHLGCGTVYLSPPEGWVNIDLRGELASDRPDLAQHNMTSVDKYYKFPYRTNRDNFVCDLKQDITSLPNIQTGSVSQILMVNVAEHIQRYKFKEALLEWRRVLKPGGELIIDQLDIKEACKMVLKAKTREELEWALHIIYCYQRDESDSHRWGYSPEYLRDILEEAGFTFCWTRKDFIKHDANYKVFQICVKK